MFFPWNLGWGYDLEKKMNSADKYREELAAAIYWYHYQNENNTWKYIVLCEEQDRVGCFIPKETI